MTRHWTLRDALDDISRIRDEEAEFWRDEARAAEDDDGWDWYREQNTP